MLLTAGDDEDIDLAPLSPLGPLGGSEAEGPSRDPLWGVFGRCCELGVCKTSHVTSIERVIL